MEIIIGVRGGSTSASATASTSVKTSTKTSTASTTKTTSIPDITYRVRADGKWYSAVKNLTDFAGVVGKAITDVAIKVSKDICATADELRAYIISNDMF